MTISALATSRAPHRYARSVAALLLGFITVFVLSLGTDQVLHMSKVYPPWGQPMSDTLFLVATAYRLVYGVVGSYITARFAPHKPMKHALLGGLIGAVLSAAGAIATWNRGPAFGPRWYPVSLIVTALPCAWAGGKIREIQGEAFNGGIERT